MKTEILVLICSQFSDIYQEETFMNMLKDDIHIVKELPPHLKSTDFEAIGSLVRRLFNLCSTRNTGFFCRKIGLSNRFRLLSGNRCRPFKECNT